MLATLASAAAAPPLAPPGAADAPTLDLYVGEERRTTITTTFGTATEALETRRDRRVDLTKLIVSPSIFCQSIKPQKASVWKRVEPSECVRKIFDTNARGRLS